MYRTIKTAASTEIIIKKSRFIANVAPAASEEEALEFIEAFKRRYWDATHNVFAYVIKSEAGDQTAAARYSDDGEPSGTAGMPVMEVLKAMELQNTVVVITRYFGGIMLGAGGLVRAYSGACREGIIKSGVVTRTLCDKYIVKIPYTHLNKVRELGFNEVHAHYSDEVALSFLVSPESDFERAITDATAGGAEITNTGEREYADRP